VGPFDNLEQAAAACDAIGRKGMPNSGRSWDEVYVREFAAVLTDGEWHVLEKAISPSDVLV
jgi:hypothetical protein